MPQAGRVIPFALALMIMPLLVGAAPEQGKKPKPKPKEPAAAEEKLETAGNIRFRRPKGWERTEKEGIVLLNPKNVSPADCSVVLVSGEGLQDELLPWFKKKWDALARGRKITDGGERNAQEGAGGVTVVYQQALLQDAKGEKKKAGQLLYAAQVAGGVEWVLFQTSDPTLFNRYNNTVSRMLSGLKFVSKQPASEDDGSGESGGAEESPPRGKPRQPREPETPEAPEAPEAP